MAIEYITVSAQVLATFLTFLIVALLIPIFIDVRGIKKRINYMIANPGERGSIEEEVGPIPQPQQMSVNERMAKARAARKFNKQKPEPTIQKKNSQIEQRKENLRAELERLENL